MYPSLIEIMNALGNKTELYSLIKKYRLELKHEGLKEKQAPLKLLLNSLYGLLNNKYSNVNRPYLAYTLCIRGMISIYTLAKRLDNIGCEIVQINTDGVAFCDGDEEEIKRVWADWEEEFMMNLELEEYSHWYQKDVNSYIAVEKNGKIKAKGDVKKYSGDSFFQNNSTRIIDIAVVEHFVNGTDPIETLYKNLDKPYLFQYILKVGRTYEGTFDQHGTKYNKINRIFASKDSNLKLQKWKKNGDSYSKQDFPNAPQKMWLWNGDCDDIENFKDHVDLQHYYDLIVYKIKMWKTKGQKGNSKVADKYDYVVK